MRVKGGGGGSRGETDWKRLRRTAFSQENTAASAA